MNPDSDLINQRFNLAFKYLRGEIYKLNIRIAKDECLSNSSNGGEEILNYYAALHYMMLIYTDLTTGFAAPTTWAEVKVEYDYENYRTCFGCKGINLVTLTEIFDLEAISLTNLDTPALIAAQATNDIPLDDNGQPIYSYI